MVQGKCDVHQSCPDGIDFLTVLAIYLEIITGRVMVNLVIFVGSPAEGGKHIEVDCPYVILTDDK